VDAHDDPYGVFREIVRNSYVRVVDAMNDRRAAERASRLLADNEPVSRAFALALTMALITTCGPSLHGNEQIADAFARRASGLEVTAQGQVERLLSDEPGPDGAHERFVIRLDGATQTVLVDHNIGIAPRVPVTNGAEVTVHGEYVWNDQGGLIHFTHHDPQHTHEDGYIILAGTRYSRSTVHAIGGAT